MTKEEAERLRFRSLCEQARAALDDLHVVSEEFKQRYATEHDVDPSQIQLFVTNNETEIEPVIRPQSKGSRRGW
jgi:hypothetical protein